MIVSPKVVLDACVLVNAALRDMLLRLAEPPRLYLPRWSADILIETRRTLEAKLGLTSVQTQHLHDELKAHFSEAWVEGYKALMPAMTNHPKDRHVMAAAVRCGAEVIVTFNLKDFPENALSPWGVEVHAPDDFLLEQFNVASQIVARKLQEQASRHGGVERLLSIHQKTVPQFTEVIRTRIMHESGKH
jgi:predicted nucleic acid-binding protein